ARTAVREGEEEERDAEGRRARLQREERESEKAEVRVPAHLPERGRRLGEPCCERNIHGVSMEEAAATPGGAAANLVSVRSTSATTDRLQPAAGSCRRTAGAGNGRRTAGGGNGRRTAGGGYGRRTAGGGYGRRTAGG